MLRTPVRIPLRCWTSVFIATLCVAPCTLTSCNAGYENAGSGAVDAANNPNAVANDHLPPVSPCTSNAPAPRALRRLTQTELNNTVVDLFNDPNAPQTTAVFNSDPVTYGFTNVAANLQVRDNMAMAVESYAESLAQYAGAHVAALSTCTTTDANCETAFINAFGKRAFRAPLTSDQVQAYTQLMASMPDFTSGVETVVSAMIQSPYFLYRSELGTPQGSTFQLTPYEIASELSYLLVGSMPDATLMAAADNEQLSTPAQIQAQATRLLQSPKAHAPLQQFFLEWLQVNQLPQLARMEGNTNLPPTTAAEMVTETRLLADEVAFTSNGNYTQLLTADHTYVNTELSQFYLMAAVAQGNFASVPLAGTGRDLGVLGQGGVLAAASQPTFASPTLRGRMVRMRMLCDSVPSPPPGVPQLDQGTPNETLRQRFTAHVTEASCAQCHDLMDPLGFTMGDYDTLGRLRPSDLENGQPVDTSGSIAQAQGDSQPAQAVSGLGQLIQDLSQNPQSQACFTRHWSMYAYGNTTWDQDACTFSAVSNVAQGSHYNLQQSLIALTQVPSFTTRVQDQ